MDCAGTLRLENKTGNSPLELKLTYKQAEGAGYTVVLDGEELEEAPAYENAASRTPSRMIPVRAATAPMPQGLLWQQLLRVLLSLAATPSSRN